MFAELYGQTYDEQGDLSGTDFKIDASRMETTNTAGSGVDGYVLTYDHSSGGFTFEQKFDGDIESIVAGNGLTGSSLDSGDATVNVVGGDGITVNADEVEATVDGITIELSASDGSGALRVKDDGITPAKINILDDSLAATDTHIIVADGTDFSNVAVTGVIDISNTGVTSFDSTVDGDGLTNTSGVLSVDVDDSTIEIDATNGLQVKADGVDHDQLAARYTESGTLTDGSSITVAANSKNIYTHTITQATTFNFTGAAIGQVLTLVITGDASNGITLGTINTNSATWNKISGDFDEANAVKNLIEIKFISTSEAWYQISQIAS